MLTLLIFLASSLISASPTSQPVVEKVQLEVPGQPPAFSYLLARPEGYMPTERPALLIVLHGTDDSAEDAMHFWSSRRHALPLLLAAPQSMDKGWRDTDLPGLRAMLDDLRRRVAFDENRVMLAGFSAGGVMTMHLVYAEQWPVCAAAALANYVPPRLALDPARARRGTPVFYAVGLTDVNHERMRAGLDMLRTAGANVDLYRPPVGHVLDAQVGQVAMDFLMLRARRAITARIDEAKKTTSPAATAVLEEVVVQARWHDPANVDATQRELAKIEAPGREQLEKARQAQREGRAVDALEVLRGEDVDLPSARIRDEAVKLREALLAQPGVKDKWEARQKQLRNEEGLKLYVGAQKLVAGGKYADAVLRCEEVLRNYPGTRAAERAQYLVDLLKDNHLVE